MYLKEIRPFACVRLTAADTVEVDVREQWQLMVRAFTRLTPLIEAHRASRALILALGGCERLLLRGTTPDRDAIEQVWPLLATRSEERRVGKEWRSRGAPDHEKRK